MIKILTVDSLKYIYCNSCGKDNVFLTRIKAFHKKDDNHNAVTLCENCLNDLMNKLKL